MLDVETGSQEPLPQRFVLRHPRGDLLLSLDRLGPAAEPSGRGRRTTDPDPSPSHRLQQLSGPGLVLLFLSSTFAAIDWGMSLEPKWFSTIYGAMLITGEALATLAFMIVIADPAGVGPAHEEGRDVEPLARPRQPAAGVRDALGLHGLLSVPDRLVGQPVGGDSLVHPPDARRLAVGRASARSAFTSSCRSSSSSSARASGSPGSCFESLCSSWRCIWSTWSGW